MEAGRARMFKSQERHDRVLKSSSISLNTHIHPHTQDLTATDSETVLSGKQNFYLEASIFKWTRSLDKLHLRSNSK